MAMPCDSGPPPAYFVYRDIPLGEPIDPTVPPTFYPPKDSDELFDALRAKYPHLKTHSERMRDAIIEFLIEERQGGQYATTASLGLDSVPASYPTTGSHSHSSSSVLSSPEMMNFSTPAYFENSPMPPVPSQHYAIRQPSISTSSGQPSPPSLDQMTGVFSLSSGPQPKQRVRRKMTEAEKIEYRKRRIVKACDKCARRKRKCHHNQPEMDSVGHPHSSTLGHKVAKSFASASSAKSSSTTIPPMSQRETESFLGHAFVDAAALDPVPDLPDLPEWAYDDGLFDDELLYPTLDIDEFLYQDSFLPDILGVPPTPAESVSTGKVLAPHAWVSGHVLAASRGVLPVLPDMPDLDKMGVTSDVGGDSGADHVTDDRSVNIREDPSVMKGRTARWKWRQESGPTVRGLSSRNRRGTDRAVQHGNASLRKQSRDGQDEVPIPVHHAEPCTEPCPDMDGESDGYGSSTSSDQDAIYEALPLDWQHSQRGSRTVTGEVSASYRDSGASEDRRLSSTSVAVSSRVSTSAGQEGRPKAAALHAANRTRQRQESSSSITSSLDRVDTRMEMFRLRRRLSTTSHISLTGLNSTINAQLGVIARPASNARLAVIPGVLTQHLPVLPLAATPSLPIPSTPSSASGPVHTRARRPSTSGALNETPHSTSEHIDYRDHHGRSGVWLERLRDTRRFRDHHGRPTSAAGPYILALLASLVLLAAFQVSSSTSQPSASLSWLLLASLSVLPASKQQSSSSSPSRWANEVQCTQANSSWLSLPSSLLSSLFGITLRAKSVEKSGPSESIVGSWLRGLMYPFELAPMRFRC